MIHRIRTIRPNLHLKHGIGASAADPLDRNPDIGQVLSQTAIVDREINKVANPLWRKFHIPSSVILSDDLLHASEALASRRMTILNQTAARTLRPPDRNIASHPLHTSATPSGPRPCRRRIRKPSSGHTRCLSQTQTHWDPPSRSRALQSIPSACRGDMEHY